MDRRVAIGLATVAVLAALFFVFRPDDDESVTPETRPSTTTQPEPTDTATTTPGTETETDTETGPPQIPWRIDARDGRLDRLRAPANAILAMTVVADTSDHVHVHGYDLKRDVAPGRPARIRFETTITGRFEIELEDAGQQIAQLTVVG